MCYTWQGAELIVLSSLVLVIYAWGNCGHLDFEGGLISRAGELRLQGSPVLQIRVNGIVKKERFFFRDKDQLENAESENACKGEVGNITRDGGAE